MFASSIVDRIVRFARALERGLFRRGELDARLSEEQRFHLEMLATRYERDGLEPGEARRRAAITFGGRTRFSEETRQEYGGRIVERVLYDARITMRALRRSPLFSAAVVLTIALGVGATTVIFSVTDHVVLRPLAYAESGRLVVLREIIEELRAHGPGVAGCGRAGRERGHRECRGARRIDLALRRAACRPSDARVCGTDTADDRRHRVRDAGAARCGARRGECHSCRMRWQGGRIVPPYHLTALSIHRLSNLR